MSRSLLVGLAGLALLALPTTTPGWAAGACDSATSTVEINACLDKLLAKADLELNRVYGEAQRSIEASQSLTAAQRRQWKDALKVAQRSWIRFRDDDCNEVVGWEWHGGTGMAAAGLQCKLDKTETRTAELQARYLPR